MACCLLVAFVIHRAMKALQHYNLTSSTILQTPDIQGRAVADDQEKLATLHLNVANISCASCCTAIDEAATNLPGVVKVTTSLPMSRVLIVYQPCLVAPQTIRTAIQQAGYPVSSREDWSQVQETLSKRRHLEELRRAFRGAAVLSVAVWFWQFASPSIWRTAPPAISSLLHFLFFFLPAMTTQIWFARRIHLGAWVHGDRASMDTLISASILLGLEYSIVDMMLRGTESDPMLIASGAFLTTVVLGGRCLDQALRAKGLDHLRVLHELQRCVPDVMTLPDMVTRPTFLLQSQDQILIPANSVIPCDCYVAVGESLVNQSVLTGESKPVLRGVGDLIMSGTTNMTADLQAIVTRGPEDSALARLAEAVVVSSDEDEILFPWVNKLLSRFVHVILTLSSTFFLIVAAKSILDGGDIMESMHAATRRAMTILSVACPCGVGLAIPSATMAGLRAALNHGVLIKGGLNTMIKLTRLSHVAVDKTGTLTQAELGVSCVHWSTGASVTEEELALLIATLERQDHSSHVVGRSVFQWAIRRMTEDQRVVQQGATLHSFQRFEGKGLVGEVRLAGASSSRHVMIGSERLMQDERVLSGRFQGSSSASIAALHAPPSHFVHVVVDYEYMGYLCIQDLVKQDAAGVLEDLRQRGLDITMLTGDSAAEADRVATAVGISSTMSSALPWEKRAAVSSLREKGKVVAMIGDGMNDMPAQSSADVGISVYNSALAGLVLTSDVTLLPGAKLGSIPRVIDIAQKAVNQARFNLVWSLAYNFVAVFVATGCLEPFGIGINVSMAGMLMAFSSISILLLSQRVS